MKRVLSLITFLTLIIASSFSSFATAYAETKSGSYNAYSNFYNPCEDTSSCDGSAVVGVSNGAIGYTAENDGQRGVYVAARNGNYSSDYEKQDAVLGAWFYVSDVDLFADNAEFMINIYYTDEKQSDGLSKDKMLKYRLSGSTAKGVLFTGWNFLRLDFETGRLNGSDVELYDNRPMLDLLNSKLTLQRVGKVQIGFEVGALKGLSIALDEVSFYNKNTEDGPVKSAVGLQRAVDFAVRLSQGIVKDASWREFLETVTSARETLNDDTAEQADYDVAMRAINDFAFDKYDTARLESLVDGYCELDVIDVASNAVWLNFSALLTEAEAILDGSTQNVYSESEYNEFVDTLERTYNGMEVSYARIDKAITQADGLIDSEYTSATWAAVEQALGEAKTIRNTDGVKAVDLKRAWENLKTAINELYPAEAFDFVLLEECDSANGFHGTSSAERMSGVGSVQFETKYNGQSATIPTKVDLVTRKNAMTAETTALTVYVYIGDIAGFTARKEFSVRIASGADHYRSAAKWDLFTEMSAGLLKSGWNYLVLPLTSAVEYTNANGESVASWSEAKIGGYGPNLDNIKHFIISFGEMTKGNKVAVDRIALAKIGSAAINAPRSVEDGPLFVPGLEEGITVIPGGGLVPPLAPEIDEKLPDSQINGTLVGWLCGGFGTVIIGLAAAIIVLSRKTKDNKQKQ